MPLAAWPVERTRVISGGGPPGLLFSSTTLFCTRAALHSREICTTDNDIAGLAVQVKCLVQVLLMSCVQACHCRLCMCPFRVVAQCTAPDSGLPEDKPRYVMGIGYPLDILICSGERTGGCRFGAPGDSHVRPLFGNELAVCWSITTWISATSVFNMHTWVSVSAALGADMYDSVYPTRTARFGVALVPSGVLKLKSIKYAQDLRCVLGICLAPACLLLAHPCSSHGEIWRQQHAWIQCGSSGVDPAPWEMPPVEP